MDFENNSFDNVLDENVDRASSQTSGDVHSWEYTKKQQINSGLDFIGNTLKDIEHYEKQLDADIDSVGEKVEKTKKIADDINAALPIYRQLISALTNVKNETKSTFSNMTFTVAQSSYDDAKENLSSIMDDIMFKSIAAANRRAKEIVAETADEVMARIQKPMDEALAKYDKQIKSRKEELKKLEKEAGGKFLTDKQFSFLIVGYAFFLAAAVWGLSMAVKREGAPGWVCVLLIIGLTSNLLFYALKFGWKGLKCLWNHVPGNND